MNTNYLGDEDFPWENYKELRDAMENDMSRMDRLLLNAEKQLIERDKFLDKWKWTKEEAKDKNTLMASTKKLWDDYLEIKAKVDQEKKEGTSRGGYKKSLIERHHGKKTG